MSQEYLSHKLSLWVVFFSPDRTSDALPQIEGFASLGQGQSCWGKRERARLASAGWLVGRLLKHADATLLGAFPQAWGAKKKTHQSTTQSRDCPGTFWQFRLCVLPLPHEKVVPN